MFDAGCLMLDVSGSDAFCGPGENPGNTTVCRRRLSVSSYDPLSFLPIKMTTDKRMKRIFPIRKIPETQRHAWDGHLFHPTIRCHFSR
ncbi:MAG: hypothetical protein DRI57_14770 [Deltaproteobacteria bacterium]|nr:MAG: hypothetical protein DRI57_14770 [Deltaproteobacteria bacterium]